jgi:hypothetical protein
LPLLVKGGTEKETLCRFDHCKQNADVEFRVLFWSATNNSQFCFFVSLTVIITVEREKLPTHLLRKSSSDFSTTVAPTTFACCCAQKIPNKTPFMIPTHTLD